MTFDPYEVERCRDCHRPVGTGHTGWCNFWDEPDYPDQWAEVDPEALAALNDAYYNEEVGEATS